MQSCLLELHQLVNKFIRFIICWYALAVPTAVSVVVRFSTTVMYGRAQSCQKQRPCIQPYLVPDFKTMFTLELWRNKKVFNASLSPFSSIIIHYCYTSTPVFSTKIRVFHTAQSVLWRVPICPRGSIWNCWEILNHMMIHRTHCYNIKHTVTQFVTQWRTILLAKDGQ